jgi:transposase
MKKDITFLFCFVDDFVQELEDEMRNIQISHARKQPRQATRVPGLSHSEIMTIILIFQESPCRNFKYFYQSYLRLYKAEFPKLPCYDRFIALMPRVLSFFVILLHCLLAPGKDLAYIDATSLAVCHPKRISRNKVFKGLAALGKTTKGWFLGFKLHVIINENGALMRVKLTPGNVDDRKVVPQMTRNLSGLLFGDKGYISKDLFHKLYTRGLKLVTGVKKSMKNILMPWNEKILLKKRSLIETVFGYLKNTLMLEHTRHRSPLNMLIHLISTLIVYQMKPSKPSISYNHCITNP